MKLAVFSSVRAPGLARALFTALLAGCLAVSARADFTGPYAVTPLPGSPYDQNGEPDAQFGNWSLSGSDYHFFSLQIDAGPAAVTFNTGAPEDDGNGNFINLVFKITAAASGPLSFNYQLSLDNTINDSAAYSINGVLTALAAGSNSVSGVTLAAGDVFGFVVAAGSQEQFHGIASDTVLTVTDFTAPVPEPSSGGWLGAGCGLGLAGMGWRRRRGPTAAPALSGSGGSAWDKASARRARVWR